MELTLNEIVAEIDCINSSIDNTQETEINSYLIKLSKLHTCINDVNIKLCNIYNICNNTNISKKLIREKTKQSLGRSGINIYNKSILKKSKKHIVDGICINVKYINSIEEIPNCPIYWVKNINQFAIRINDAILRGNMGNIYNTTHIKKNVSTNRTIICENKNICKNLVDGYECKFYHDPIDLLKLFNSNKISLELFEKYKNKHRNFSNTSWIYTEHNNNKNKNIRQFGSKNTLKNDIELMTIDNSITNMDKVDNFTHQFMHDLLVILSLNQFNLLNKK
jgi:hypothetical protein